MPLTLPNGVTYTDQQVTEFISGGGDPNAFLQEQGVTNQDLIHTLATQARIIAGGATPTGDAALQNYFKSYQKYNPNGAYANNYSGWVNDLGAGTANAMRAGTYSGAVTAPKDFAPGGIYAPGTGHDFSYAQSGLGARGMGEGWNPGVAPLGSGPQTSQPMMVNPNGALVYSGTGTSTAPIQGGANWVQPPGGQSFPGGNQNFNEAGPLTTTAVNVVQPGQSAGTPGTPTPGMNWGTHPAQTFNTPMLDALYNAQQQRMTSAAPTFNFQAKPGALTQAIEG